MLTFVSELLQQPYDLLRILWDAPILMLHFDDTSWGIYFSHWDHELQVWQARYVLPAFGSWADAAQRRAALRGSLVQCLQASCCMLPEHLKMCIAVTVMLAKSFFLLSLMTPPAVGLLSTIVRCCATEVAASTPGRCVGWMDRQPAAIPSQAAGAALPDRRRYTSSRRPK